MKWRERTLDDIATLICGNRNGNKPCYFPYRSSSYITRFFRDADTDYAHGGQTRDHWVSGVLGEILAEPHADAQTPPDTFCRVIRVLMDPADATEEGPERENALKALNIPLGREGFEASGESHMAFSAKI